MKNKIIFILIILTTKVFAQQGFETIISTSTDLYARQLLCISDGFLVVGSRKMAENIDGIIYKLDIYGSLVDSLILENNDEYSAYKMAFFLENGLIRTFSMVEKEDLPDYYNIKAIDIDENLNIYNELLYENIEIGNFWAHLHTVTFQNEVIYFASTAIGSPPNSGIQYFDKFMLKMNQEGEILFDSIYNQSSLEMTMDFIRFPGTDNLILFCTPNFMGGNELKPINIIDTNFNLIESYYIEDYSLQASLRAINDTMFIISNKESGDKKEPWYTAISTYDLNFERINHVITGQVDTASYPAYNNSIAIIEDQIFVGSTYNVIPYDFTSSKSYFRLDKLDLNLNLEWQKYYGGDAYYKLIDVRETPDNSVILTGTRYEHGESGPFESDIFVLKVDENGLITSTNEQQSIPIKNAIIMPNPGKEYLQLHTGIFPTTLQMFDINGKLILEENINKESTSINTQSLSAGTYIWQLVKDGQVVENDKWVKE